MSRRDITVAAWRRAVFASRDRHMTGAVKVLCLYLADHMNADRKVSLPRQVIADALGCHPQRVAERLKAATDGEFLTSVLTGRPGRTAVYQGCWPDPKSVETPQRNYGEVRTAPQDALSSWGAVRQSEAEQRNGAGVRTAPLDAISRADLSRGLIEGDVEKRSNEEHRPPEAAACVDVCDGDLYDEPCRAACRAVLTDHREESA